VEPERSAASDPLGRDKSCIPVLYVNAVVEVHEVGQVVYACPVNRLTGSEARAHRFEERTVRPLLRMTIHAGL